MFLSKLNPIEPPWYGPVCPVVWEGRRREASPYPDLRRNGVNLGSEPRDRYLMHTGPCQCPMAGQKMPRSGRS
jgi:hypothetical protein